MAEDTHRHAWAGLFGGLVLLASIAMLGFLPETMAIAWHIRYGTRVSVGQYQVPVPLLWMGSFEDDQRSLSAITVMGRFRQARIRKSRVGMIVYSVSSPLDAADAHAVMSRLDERMGTSTAASSLTVGGQPTTCFTTIHPAAVDFVDIRCLPPSGTQGLTVDFIGDRSMVPQFYDLLRQVGKKPGAR